MAGKSVMASLKRRPMRYPKYLLVFLLALSGTCVIAEELQKSLLTPKRTGDLSIAIVASDNSGYIKDLLASPSGQDVEITKLKVVSPNQSIYTSFLVTGIYLGLNEEYHYKVSFYVLGPDGKPVFGQRNFASGRGKHPKKPSMYLADPVLELVFKPEDPKGKYLIVARVEDQTNGQVAKNQYELFLQESATSGQRPTGKNNLE